MIIISFSGACTAHAGSVKDNMGPFSRGGLVYVRGLCKVKFWRARELACKCLLIYCNAIVVHSLKGKSRLEAWSCSFPSPVFSFRGASALERRKV